MVNIPDDLSPALLPLVEFELSLGNLIKRVDEKFWTRCPLAIVFAGPLHFAQALAKGLISEGIQRWECRDPHYEIEAGYVDPVTCHTLSGPVPPDRSE